MNFSSLRCSSALIAPLPSAVVVYHGNGNYLDCTDSPAMLIGGHSADAGDHSEVDTSLDGSYLDQGKRCVDGTGYQYAGCMANGGMRNDGTHDAPIWTNSGTYEDSVFAVCRVPCLAECLAEVEGAFDAIMGSARTEKALACSEHAHATDDILLDAFCAKYVHGDVKRKGPLPDYCCAQEKDSSGAYPENDPCFKERA